MNNLNASCKSIQSIQSGLSNTYTKNENELSLPPSDEIHCNKNTDHPPQTNSLAPALSPARTEKSSLQSLYEDDEECSEQKEREPDLESGLYNNNNKNNQNISEKNNNLEIQNNNSSNANNAANSNTNKAFQNEGGFEPWNTDKNNPDNPKRYTYTKDRIFTLNENGINENTNICNNKDKNNNKNSNNSTQTEHLSALRTNSLSDMKIGIHRKISSERSKPKRLLRKHSSLKEFKVEYSSNLQLAKRADKAKNFSNHSNHHQKEGKRVGLPAELFANDVSFTVKSHHNNTRDNTPIHTPPTRLKPPKASGHNSNGGGSPSDINGSFYSISSASPVSSYSNPYFQSDDVIYSSPLLPSTSACSLDLSRVTKGSDKSSTKPSPRLKRNNTTSDFTV